MCVYVCVSPIRTHAHTHFYSSLEILLKCSALWAFAGFSFLFIDHHIGGVALILNPCFEKENGWLGWSLMLLNNGPSGWWLV